MLKPLSTKHLLFSLVFTLLSASASWASEVSVAVAANFLRPMKALSQAFEQQTGTKIIVHGGSTGMLYGQIASGAPMDLFFAADEKRPGLLFEKGLAEKPVVYARGAAVLWTGNPGLMTTDSWTSALASGSVVKMALASPKTAPYGAAAVAAMKKAGVMARVESRLVYAKNVSQSFQYGVTGSVELAFCALSQALSPDGKKGKYWLLPGSQPVIQAACVLTGAANKTGAEEFLKFVTSPQSRRTLNTYGYE